MSNPFAAKAATNKGETAPPKDSKPKQVPAPPAKSGDAKPKQVPAKAPEKPEAKSPAPKPKPVATPEAAPASKSEPAQGISKPTQPTQEHHVPQHPVAEPVVQTIAAAPNLVQIPASFDEPAPPLSMDEVSCRTCRFLHYEGNDRGQVNHGECRRNAPVPGHNQLATWPAVLRTGWCGEWETGVSDEDMVKMARSIADGQGDSSQGELGKDE